MNLKTKRIIRRAAYSLCVLISIILFSIAFADWKIANETKQYVFDDPSKIPNQKVGLVLGTSKYVRGGRLNAYFSYRIDAAKELYDARKVCAFVVSGDNAHVSYNEPREMRNALIAKGIPDSIIYMDYAGFRTLDSVVRTNKVFGQGSFIVISQRFHTERAVYIARHLGIDAYGYNSLDLALNKYSIKTKIREKFARVKVFIDILIGKKPKFLGEPIKIK